ncbi:hypothetical protein M3Y99_01238900 [Aphelenchoides fujianensis]|nr:hypothetical protein M3Y99_01238900 [Aphelenchoides fujianensis]
MATTPHNADGIPSKSARHSITKEDVRSCDRCVRRCSNAHWEARIAELSPAQLDGEALQKQFEDYRKAVGDRQKESDYQLSAGSLADTTVAGSSLFEISQQLGRARRLTAEERRSTLRKGWRSAKMYERELELLKDDVKAALLQTITFRQGGILDGTSEEFLNAVQTVKEKYDRRKVAAEEAYRSKLDYVNRSYLANLDIAEKTANRRIEEYTQQRLKAIDEKLRELGCEGPDYELPKPKIRLQPSSLCQLKFADGFAAAVLPVAGGLKAEVRKAERDELHSFLLFGKPSKRTNALDEFSVDKLPSSAHRLSSSLTQRKNEHS